MQWLCDRGRKPSWKKESAWWTYVNPLLKCSGGSEPAGAAGPAAASKVAIGMGASSAKQEVDTCRQKSHHPWQPVYGVEVGACGADNGDDGMVEGRVWWPFRNKLVAGLDKIFTALA